MTKAEVIAEIAQSTGVEKLDVQRIIESFIGVVKESVAKDENVYIRGFGSFITKERAPKVARNIKKNTTIMVDAHHVPSFKPAKLFVAEVKENMQKIKNIQ